MNEKKAGSKTAQQQSENGWMAIVANMASLRIHTYITDSEARDLNGARESAASLLPHSMHCRWSCPGLDGSCQHGTARLTDPRPIRFGMV